MPSINRKKIIVIIIISLILLSPLLLLTETVHNMMMGWVSNAVREAKQNKTDPPGWAPWLLHKIYLLNVIKFDHEKQYQAATNFYLWFPKDSRHADMLYNLAYVCDEHFFRRNEATYWYEEFLDRYSEHPLAEKAEQAIIRLRH